MPKRVVSVIAGTKKTTSENTCVPRRLSMKLSVIIITKNESANIKECLDSVRFATQVIIVDSGSEDETCLVASEHGATVIQRTDWRGFGTQKNRALEAADGEWILSIDADERIPLQLQSEILYAIETGQHTAYAIPRLSSFCGTFIHHCGWYPDAIVRLFRRDAARFSDDQVHEKVIVSRGRIGRLQTPMIHYSYRSDSDYLRKLQQYSELGAQQAFAAGKRATLKKAIGHAFAAFIRTYIFKLGFLDGRAGLMVAISSAESSYHKYIKLMLLGKEARMSDRN